MDGKPRQNGKAEKERLIIDAAVKLFSHKGAEKTKIIAIAELAGIGKSTFYEYFKNKGHLICRWMELQIAGFLSKDDGFSDLRSNAEKITALFMHSCDTAFANDEHMTMFLEFWRLALNEKDPAAYRLINRLYTEYRNLFQQYISEGIQNREFANCDDTGKTAAAMLAGIDGLWLQYLIFGKDYDIESHARTFIHTMLAGITIGKMDDSGLSTEEKS
jgi:AcrR family transcriptional regulator